MAQRIDSRLLTDHTRPLWLCDGWSVWETIQACYGATSGLVTRHREAQYGISVKDIIVSLGDDMAHAAEEGSSKTVGSAAADIVAYIYERYPMHLQSVPYDWQGRPFTADGQWDHLTNPDYRRAKGVTEDDILDIARMETNRAHPAPVAA